MTIPDPPVFWALTASLSAVLILRADPALAAAKKRGGKGKGPARTASVARKRPGGKPGKANVTGPKPRKQFSLAPAGWPAWRFASLGGRLDAEVAFNERLMRQGDARNSSYGWECVRALSRLLHGPGDPRVWAALSRNARAVADSLDEPRIAEAAASMARGALEGFLRSASGSGERDFLVPELRFALETLRKAGGPASLRESVASRAEAVLAGMADGGESGDGGDGPSSVPEAGTGGMPGGPAAEFRELTDGSGVPGLAARTLRELDRRLRAGLEAARALHGPAGDGSGGPDHVKGAKREAVWMPPKAVSAAGDADADSAGGCGGDGGARAGRKDGVPETAFTLDAAMFRSDADNFRKTAGEDMDWILGRLAQEGDRRHRKSSWVKLAMRSSLGSVMADVLAARALWKAPEVHWGGSEAVPGGGSEADPGGRSETAPGGGSEAEPDGWSETETEEIERLARELLVEGFEGMEREDGLAEDTTMAAGFKLVRYLRGESGPEMVFGRLPEELPPEEDLRLALEICGRIRKACDRQGPVGQDRMHPVWGMRLLAALTEARCLSDLGDRRGAARLRREAAKKAGQDPEALADDIPKSLLLAQLRFDLAESVRDEGNCERAYAMHVKALAGCRACAGAFCRLTLASAARNADMRAATGDVTYAAGLYARSAETLETWYPLDPAVPELRFKACEIMFFMEPGELRLRLMSEFADELGRRLGGNHPRVTLCDMKIAESCRTIDDMAGAEERYSAVVRKLEGGSLPRVRVPSRAAGLRDRHLGDALGGLGIMLANRGDFGGAAELFAREREIVSRTDGPDSEKAALALFQEAEARRGGGDPEESLRLHKRALEARTRTLGARHPDTLMSRRAVDSTSRKP
ncbi:MAG: tetratricopeptide repeat protein [Deltaproteobacteria bacterium]|jgi:tetratricopeptide (TPR) repeat protein|nr:tetratricopeptide repeat protein [Deltaproteobacteria bacterium]